MSLPNQIHPFHVVGAGSQYQVARSLRFRKSNSAYLSRTPSGAGNRQTWTWSGWVKFASIVSTDYPTLFMGGATQSDTGALRIGIGTNNLVVQGYNTNFIVSSQVFRDPSAWYHILIAFDTTQATASNRLKAYVNGTQITSFSTDNRASLTQNTNYGINQAALHRIGYESATFGSTYSDFYLGEYYFIDGQALTPSSFGTTDSVTGAWIPTRYTGTYGTNGFYLPFSDNSGATATTIGKDSSGNGNNWTPSGISVTAGTTNDSLVDSPTSYGSDTGVGGEARGNYCTINPLRKSASIAISNGNLYIDGNSGSVQWESIASTFLVKTGKWYFEFLVSSTYAAGNHMVGLAREDVNWSSSGQHYLTENSATGKALDQNSTTNDVVCVAFDMDLGYAWGTRNASLGTNPTNGLSPDATFSTAYYWGPAFSMVCGRNNTGWANFGQRPFAYTAPSGFKALCTQNLPTPTIGLY